MYIGRNLAKLMGGSIFHFDVLALKQNSVALISSPLNDNDPFTIRHDKAVYTCDRNYNFVLYIVSDIASADMITGKHTRKSVSCCRTTAET